MNMIADIAVERELAMIAKIIKDMKSIGKTDTEILDHIERDIEQIIEDCKTGYR